MTEILGRPALGATDRVGAGAWIDELDHPLTCVAITDVTHDVKSFTFHVPAPGRLRFRPGQYLTFRLPIGGAATERCYTISSTPLSPEELTITVKRVPGGPVSGWLHDRLRVGDRVRASGPFGKFSHTCHPAPRYLFLSAGSGITPLMSMTRTLCATSSSNDVVFVHSARTPADIIFRDELDAIADRRDVGVAVVCEEDAPGQPWAGPRGRLSSQLLRALVPDLDRREVFTCGPPAYMESVRALLDVEGVDPGHRHEESFHLGALPRAAEEAEGAGRRFRVELRRSGRVVECDGSTTLLESALEAGVVLPSSCEEGVCGTCKLTLLSGRVDIQNGGGIRPREIAQDRILVCCSRPLDDVVLDA